MENNVIRIPTSVEGEEFYSDNLVVALSNSRKQHNPLFMPSLIDARINSPKGARFWQNRYDSVSARITGKTKAGNAVVVYAHKPNYLSDPKNIEKAKKLGLVNGAGIVPQNKFQRLLDLEDGSNVFVVDNNILNNSTNGVVAIKDALKHPQTIPFIGSEERAEAYLKRFEEVYGNKIGIWYYNDLGEQPLGRLLSVGDDCDDGLGGDRGLDGDGRFVGVPKKSAVGASQKVLPMPNKRQLGRVIKEFVAPCNVSELEKRLDELSR